MDRLWVSSPADDDAGKPSGFRQLRGSGIEVVMLTGDSNAVAKAVAEELGITQYFAEVLPEHKDDQVAQLQAQGRKVAMVGDGVNNAPACTSCRHWYRRRQWYRRGCGIRRHYFDPEQPARRGEDFYFSTRHPPQDDPKSWWATGYNIVTIPLAAGILAGWGINLSPAVGACLCQSARLSWRSMRSCCAACPWAQQHKCVYGSSSEYS